jgi:hypothetical protein
MTMSDKQDVRVTGEDIASAGEKLREFAHSLPENEKAVIGWLVERAAESGSSDDVGGYLLQSPGIAHTQVGGGVVNPTLFAAGAPQLSALRPGSLASSSVTISVGVMF